MTDPAARTTYVLVHGNAGSETSWSRVVEGLGAEDAFALNLLRWASVEGPSVRRLGPLEYFVVSVLALTEVLVAAAQPPAGPVVLGGNGIGSVLCGHAALRLGESCRGVVMTGPVGLRGGHESLGWLARHRVGASFLRFAGRSFGRRKFLRDQLAHPDRDPEAARILLDALRDARGFHLLARLNRPESLAGIRDLRCPVTVLWGDRDGVLPVTRAEEFMTHLPPHARLEIVPDAGHALPLERPDVVARALRDLE